MIEFFLGILFSRMALVFAGEGFFAPEDGRIHAFTLDEEAPALRPSAVTNQGGTFPVWLTVHPNHKSLYATDSTPDGSAGYVHTYALGKAGTLTPLGEKQSTGGAIPCHLSIMDNHLLVANYVGEPTVGGNIAALPINADGSLAPATSVVSHGKGSGGHVSGRQAESHPHMIQPDPEGKFAFVCDLGTNSVIGYTLSDGALTKCSEFVLHNGAGPRHLSFSATSPFVYVLNELDNTVVPLRYDAQTGSLSAIDTLHQSGKIRALADGTPGASGGGAAEILCSNDGRFAYGSVRRCGKDNAAEEAVFNCIAIFGLDGDSGAATLLATVPSGGDTPWTHALAGADDELLLVQNQSKSVDGGPGVIVVFSRNKDTGMLTATEATVDVPQNVSLCVVRPL